MERYPQYSKVILKDGRTATVVEILKENVEYIVDVDLEGPDWDTIDSRIKRALGYSSFQKAVRDHADEEDRVVNESCTVNGTRHNDSNASTVIAAVLF